MIATTSIAAHGCARLVVVDHQECWRIDSAYRLRSPVGPTSPSSHLGRRPISRRLSSVVRRAESSRARVAVSRYSGSPLLETVWTPARPADATRATVTVTHIALGASPVAVRP